MLPQLMFTFKEDTLSGTKEKRMKIKIELELDTDRDAHEIEQILELVESIKERASDDDE
jgi:hypothetical protein